tara:strand:- start:202 stop:384 length:183 start_codon:yes stop_codon:yes gene_type:complete
MTISYFYKKSAAKSAINRKPNIFDLKHKAEVYQKKEKQKVAFYAIAAAAALAASGYIIAQ